MSTGNRHGGVGSTIARHLLLTVILLAGFFTVVYVASLLQNPPIHYLGRGFDLVTGELKDPADPNLRKAGLLFPSYVPHDLPLAGIIRAPHSVFYLLFDKIPLESGEFRLSERVEAGAIILLQTPSPTTSRQREAFIASAIEETDGKIERVEVNGLTGAIGHGEIPQLRWWQFGYALIIIGRLTDAEFLAMAESVHSLP